MAQEAGFTESAVTLDNGIAAIVTQPAAEGPVPAVVMLHGFASYKDEVGEMYKRLAAALAQRGIASLRLDFRGWGESEGGMENSTVQGMVEDAATGYAYLSSLDFVDAGRIGVIGFSLGGRIAIVSGAQNPDWYSSMALWSTGGNIAPIFWGRRMWTQPTPKARSRLTWAGAKSRSAPISSPAWSFTTWRPSTSSMPARSLSSPVQRMPTRQNI